MFAKDCKYAYRSKIYARAKFLLIYIRMDAGAIDEFIGSRGRRG